MYDTLLIKEIESIKKQIDSVEYQLYIENKCNKTNIEKKLFLIELKEIYKELTTKLI